MESELENLFQSRQKFNVYMSAKREFFEELLKREFKAPPRFIHKSINAVLDDAFDKGKSGNLVALQHDKELMDFLVVGMVRFMVKEGFPRQSQEYVDDESLSFYIDPGTAPSEDIAELLTELSTLYRMAGGSGITFTIAGTRQFQGELV